ncbi:dynein regulatory complex protein 11-like [Pecten maximus]|nr:dynein regulatory complex protein 11-like [Pecten maximus]
MNGIIVRTPNIKLMDYEGEYSYLGTTLRQANIEPMPSLSDVRRLVTEFGILPLGSPAVHEKAPLTKSILLAGPRGTGKKMLVQAVCNETGANMFDLSPANIVGKYPGKDGLKMLMHLVFKVGRELQPSVIYIGDCERMFKKKVPKTDPTDPKRLKKELPKALKTIKSDDRLLLVGTSRCPFDGEMKPLTSCYQRIILIPRPDYASRHLLWRRIILKNNGVLTAHLDISSLSKVTDGYTPGHMATAVQQVLTERRIQTLSKKPLQAVEFIAPLARIDPIYKEEEESFKSWYAKTPLGKKRAKAAAADDDDGGGGKGGKKGKKGGKKKGGKKKKKK